MPSKTNPTYDERYSLMDYKENQHADFAVILCSDIHIIRRACIKGLQSSRNDQTRHGYENILSSLDSILEQVGEWTLELDEYRKDAHQPELDYTQFALRRLLRAVGDVKEGRRTMNDLYKTAKEIEHAQR